MKPRFALFGRPLSAKDAIVLAVIAILIFPGSYFFIPKAWASSAITSSSAKFYGPALERFLITDSSKTNLCDTITVHVKAARGSATLAESDVTLYNIGTSGEFEMFVTTSNFPFVPANPTYNAAYCAGQGDSPFMVRINQAPLLNTTPGAHETGLTISPASVSLKDGDSITVSYAGQQLNVNFAKSTVSATTDRQVSGLGNGGIVVVKLTDKNAVLDPTSIDTIDSSTSNSNPPVNDSPLSATGGTMNFAGAKFIEEGQNTGIFDMPVKVISGPQGAGDPNPVNGATLSGVTFPSSINFQIQGMLVYNQSLAKPVGGSTTSPGTWASVPYNSILVNSGATSITYIIAQNSDGAVSVRPVSPANGLAVTITDPDQNSDTKLKDFLPAGSVSITMDGLAAPRGSPGNLWINNGTNANVFQETGFSTGKFQPALVDQAIPIHLTTAGAERVDQTGIYLSPQFISQNNNLYVTYTDPNASPAGVKQFILVTTVNHISGNIIPTQQTAVLNNNIKLTINDSDLNTSRDVKDSFFAVFNGPNSNLENPGQCFVTGEGCLTMKVDGLGLNFAANPLVITFRETGTSTGVFVASNIPMGIINAASTAAGDPLRDGSQIQFTYHDHSENPVHTSTATVSVRANLSLSVDRLTIPNPMDGAGPVKFTLSIEDPRLNTNPTSIQSWLLPGGGPAGVTLMATATEKDGVTTVPGTIGGLTSAVNTLIPQTFTETAAGSGVFTFQYVLFAGTTSLPALDGAKIKFTYTSGGVANSITVTIKSHDGSVMSTQSTVTNGDTIALIVVDKDLTRDNTVINQACVTVDALNDTVGIPTTFCDLKETALGSGIFIKTITIGSDIKIADSTTNKFATVLQVHYTDQVDSHLSVNVDRVLNMKIATSSGTLSASPSPATATSKITILVTDNDLNVDPNAKVTTSPSVLYLRVTSNATNANVLGLGITGTETEPGSGIFMTTLTLATASSASTSGHFSGSGSSIFGTALPGDKITITYFDQKNALGKSANVVTTVQVK